MKKEQNVANLPTIPESELEEGEYYLVHTTTDDEIYPHPFSSGVSTLKYNNGCFSPTTGYGRVTWNGQVDLPKVKLPESLKSHLDKERNSLIRTYGTIDWGGYANPSHVFTLPKGSYVQKHTLSGNIATITVKKHD